MLRTAHSSFNVMSLLFLPKLKFKWFMSILAHKSFPVTYHFSLSSLGNFNVQGHFHDKMNAIEQ